VSARRAAAAAALLALGGALAPSQAQALRATIRPDTVTVGDRLAIDVAVELPAGARAAAAAPVFEGGAPEGVRLLGADTLSAAGEGRLRGSLRLAAFRPGPLKLPALLLPWTRGDGSPPDTLRAAPAPVVVASVLPAPPATPTLRDIKDLAALPRGPRLWPWLLLAALAAAALAAWAWRRRRTRGAPTPAARTAAAPRTPYERALERLEAIARARLPEAGRVEEHYDRAADVLRAYLEEAEGVPALERTTSELAWALPPLLSGDGGRDASLELLTDADLVKFARQRPHPAAAHGWLAGLRDLLRRWHDARAAEEARGREAARAAEEADLASAGPAGPSAAGA
jgi:hypothetical protein